MDIKLIPTKQLYCNPISNYRIIACQPIDVNFGITLNKYGNLSVSGSNLSSFKIGQEIEVSLREDQNAKYPASYKLIGYPGVTGGEHINIDPKREYSMLCGFMEPSQAGYVNDAYPHFIEMVMNNQESELDYKKIYNVGKVRIESYIEKIKANYKSILYYPIAGEWGIDNQKIIEDFVEIFATPEELKEAFDENPYHVFIDLAHYPFDKTDRIVLEKRPDLIDSIQRCEHGCLDILKENENAGDTRINANLLAKLAKDKVPEAMHHIVEAVSNSERIYYDPETKNAAIRKTYEAELNIAENIKMRVENPIDDGFDWEKFREVDSFICTDEQTEILKTASANSVAILTGSGGSGKTSSMKALILMLEHYHKDYVLLTPTGVSSKRLQQSTGRPASTIHRYLASGAVGRNPDFVILDEATMISVDILSALFNAVPNHTKFIFVCDNAQLASISCGNIVQDILDSGIVPQAKLTKVFRYGSSGIATIATDVRNGELTDTGVTFDDYHFIKADKNPVAQVVDLYEELLEEGYNKDDIMVLCPFNKSDVGSYVINEAIQTRFNNHKPSGISYKRDTQEIGFKVGDKVINTHNNYHVPVLDYGEEGNLTHTGVEMFVANGDIGYVRMAKIDEDGCAKMAVEFDEGLGDISGNDIMDLLLGYSLSVHKSQGSQAKVVIVVIDKHHKNMVTRNLTYVSCSRAQERLYLIGDKSVIEDGLEREENKERDTNLKDLLLTNTPKYDIMNKESEDD